jgi:predicted phage terminase large subunit-like protein
VITHLYHQLLKTDYEAFIEKSFETLCHGREFLPNWHIRLIAEYLEACRTGTIRRLIINMPPRALKSLCVSVAWPAFLLGHNPTSRIIAASYAQGLSLKLSLDSRHLLGTDWYRLLFPHTRLAKDQNTKGKFLTTGRGFRLATSTGGTLTGEGGDYLIVDDPQNPSQAMSTRKRQLAAEWFDHTFASRLDDKQKGVMVLVMQRLHEEDLSGYLLAKGGWEHLCLPAIAPAPQLYSIGSYRYERGEGELLHPAREDAALLARAQQELGAYAFAAQYQQAPYLPEGGMIQRRWLSRYEARPTSFRRIVQSWDTAIKGGSHHDASACITLGEAEGGYYLLEALAFQLEFPALKQAVLSQAGRWQPDAVLVEDAASGQSLLQELRTVPAEPGKPPLPLVAIRPKGDKISRVARITALMEAGLLHLPRQAEWLAECEAELLAFPHGRHDDRVDALTQALEWLRQGTRSPRMRGL